MAALSRAAEGVPDLLKGIAIFMVVMGHVLTMCIRGIDSAALFKIIGEVHMPLFRCRW